MKNKETHISSVRLNRIRAQGYCNITDANLSELAFGNGFAYIGCGLIILVGVILASIPVLATMMVIAFFGIILTFHPFDYIYNYAISGIINKPKLPKRSKQLKFACTIATTWIAVTIYLFYTGLSIAAYISGGVMLSIVFLVSTTDLCVPSFIYNYLFSYKME